jgi:hypothetical protein
VGHVPCLQALLSWLRIANPCWPLLCLDGLAPPGGPPRWHLPAPPSSDGSTPQHRANLTWLAAHAASADALAANTAGQLSLLNNPAHDEPALA